MGLGHEKPSSPLQQQACSQKHNRKPHGISCCCFYVLWIGLKSERDSDFWLQEGFFAAPGVQPCFLPTARASHCPEVTEDIPVKSLAERRMRHCLLAVKTQNYNFLFNSRK